MAIEEQKLTLKTGPNPRSLTLYFYNTLLARPMYKIFFRLNRQLPCDQVNHLMNGRPITVYSANEITNYPTIFLADRDDSISQINGI